MKAMRASAGPGLMSRNSLVAEWRGSAPAGAGLGSAQALTSSNPENPSPRSLTAKSSNFILKSVLEYHTLDELHQQLFMIFTVIEPVKKRNQSSGRDAAIHLVNAAGAGLGFCPMNSPKGKELLTMLGWLLAWALATHLPARTTAAAAEAGSQPVVYCTDLFHPHDGPDDHFDLAGRGAGGRKDAGLSLVIPGKPSPAAEFAARELQHYLEALTGARFGVSTQTHCWPRRCGLERFR